MSVPYFLIHSVVVEKDVALVDGRLGEFGVRVGHHFTSVFPTLEARNQSKIGAPCLVIVRGIEAYGHQLQDLSPGMTARLSVQGSSLSVLESAGVLE